MTTQLHTFIQPSFGHQKHTLVTCCIDHVIALQPCRPPTQTQNKCETLGRALQSIRPHYPHQRQRGPTTERAQNAKNPDHQRRQYANHDAAAASANTAVVVVVVISATATASASAAAAAARLLRSVRRNAAFAAATAAGDLL